MFYRPQDGHGLPHNPYSAIVSPRPIAWVSTRGTDGRDNLAPYSFFNATAYDPPQVMFCSTATKQDRGDTKDSVGNIRETGVFCINIVEYAARDAMNATSGSYGREVDEFDHAGLAKAACESIDCAFVATAPAALECRLIDFVTLKGETNYMVMGEVTGIHLRDDCVIDGRFDVTAYAPLARLGYRDYARVADVFCLGRPDEK